VIRYFSGNNPLNVILLFFAGIFLKLPYFITPVIPTAHSTDGFLYAELLKALQPTGAVLPVIYTIIAYLLLFTQAVTFNGLINGQKLFTSPNYLLALSYILISSIVPEWNVLSPALIINTILVWAWPYMVGLFNHPKPKNVLFNIGFGFALCSFVYFPSIYLLVLLFIALFLFRPFYLTEWLIALLGILTPVYFLLVYFFVWDHWDQVNTIIRPQYFKLPVLHINWRFYVTISLVAFPVVVGFLFSANYSSRLLVQTRKSWSFMMFYLIIALIIPFINSSAGLSNWVLSLIPLSLFYAAFYFYPQNKRLPEILFWLSTGWIVANYIILNSL
jgi:hypothetical protein